MKLATQGYVLPTKPDKDNALVYIVRPSGVARLIKFNVFLDDKEKDSEMGYTRGDSFIYFFVSPGKHKILSKAENWAEVESEIKAGDVVFIKQNPLPGWIIARNSLELVDELEGKYWLKNSSLDVVLKEKK